MLFRDFLRVAVMLFGGASTALAIVAIAGASGEDTNLPVYMAVGWWVVAAVAGLWLGRRHGPTEQISKLLAGARNANAIPEIEPGRMVVNRLWALALLTVVSGGIAFLIPQIPAIAAGYSLGVALTWRNQPRAVQAIEERDGVRYYLDRTSPFAGPRLLRTPGLRNIEVERRAVL
jgi:hypothetical protein